jgi:predicted dithiol-disulfide oxidoreductase (DUF899 family)
MNKHKVGTHKEWLKARLKLLKEEKKVTRHGDKVTRLRQALPWVRIEKKYVFETEKGKASLADLFQGRSQLVVYHFMFGPTYTAGCPGCSATADSFDGVLPHLGARDTTMICISRAPLKKLLTYRRRMGWSFDWVSSHGSDFNFDFGVSPAESGNEGASPLESNEVAMYRMLGDRRFRDSLPPIVALNAKGCGTDLDGYFSEGHGVSVFARKGKVVYHTYSSYARGTEFILSFYPILDRTPKARDEEGSMGPWLRRHDEYGEKSSRRA